MQKIKSFVLVLLLAVIGPGFGQPVSQAERSIDADLSEALTRYEQLQKKIRDERIPLDRELNALNLEIQQKRQEAQRSQRLRDNRSVDLNAMRLRVERQQEQVDYVANLVRDFAQRFERDIDLSEHQIYGDLLDVLRLGVESRHDEEDSLARPRRAAEQFVVFNTAMERFGRLLGGDLFSGQAVGAGGNLVSGQFIAVGPTTFFASSNNSVSGLSLKTGIMPPVVSIGEDADRMISSFAGSSSGLLPLDPTLGSAFAIAAQKETIWEHIQKGGIWIWPILFFAMLATLTALFKMFEIYSVKMPPPGSLHDILKAINEGDKVEATRLAEAIQGPSRAMLIDAVNHSDETKELVEEVMYERMLELQPRLERMLPFIAVTAATAPLMGLLGTVTGMINTFKLITIFGTGDAKSLSSGISEALVTTEFGLIVAIPALIIHALLSRRAQGVMANMERMAVAFINGLSRKN